MTNEEKLEKKRQAVLKYKGAPSQCSCGHTGDAEGFDHAGLMGHGPCLLCDCNKFQWAGYAPELQKILDDIDDAE